MERMMIYTRLNTGDIVGPSESLIINTHTHG